MILNEGQQNAVNKIVAWYNDKNSQQVFTLSGWAGTGKSTVISHCIENILCLDESEYAFCTPTGKAATVLISKGSNATTIHRLIYTPVETVETVENSKGELVKKRSVDFIRKPTLGVKLIIIDEFSMVSNEIFKDLLSYGVKILAVGDNGQLPPVKSAQLKYLLNPDVQLTEIVRQNSDNQILTVAEMARNGKWINYGTYGSDVIVYDKRCLTESELIELYTTCDQIIAGRNATCKQINDKIRSYLGFTSEYPEPGDKLICLQNNYNIELNDRFQLVNGIIGMCESFDCIDYSGYKFGFLKFTPELTHETVDEIICDPYEIIGVESKYEQFQEYYVLPRGKYAPKVEIRKRKQGESFEEYQDFIKPLMLNKRSAISIERMNHFNFGYCISCHKSQGSEWDTVVIIDESYCFNSLKSNWLYTAITRAKKKCIIIK